MSEQHHVADAPVESKVVLLSDEDLGPDLVIVCDDAFATRDSSPNPPDTVTIAAKKNVIRGEIVNHAYIVRVKQ